MSQHCPHCKSSPSSSESRSIIKSGSFTRKSDQEIVQRFYCKICSKHFSAATSNPCYLQKKRYLNAPLFKFLVSGGTLRRAAILFKTNRKTVARKLIFLGLCAEEVLKEYRNSLSVTEFQVDDLETFEHSKLKPLSVTIAVESKTRRVLGFRVAQMPAKGLLVKRSLKKYGYRKDERRKARQELFLELQKCAANAHTIKSDENPHYKNDVKKFFPNAVHKAYLGQRGCVVGQGELKGGGFDPLFSLNHTYAMFRANVSRLFRRTWNTTKCRHRLSLHLALYSLVHNLHLIKDEPWLPAKLVH